MDIRKDSWRGVRREDTTTARKWIFLFWLLLLFSSLLPWIKLFLHNQEDRLTDSLTHDSEKEISARRRWMSRITCESKEIGWKAKEIEAEKYQESEAKREREKERKRDQDFLGLMRESWGTEWEGERPKENRMSLSLSLFFTSWLQLLHLLPPFISFLFTSKSVPSSHSYSSWFLSFLVSLLLSASSSLFVKLRRNNNGGVLFSSLPLLLFFPLMGKMHFIQDVISNRL